MNLNVQTESESDLFYATESDPVGSTTQPSSLGLGSFCPATTATTTNKEFVKLKQSVADPNYVFAYGSGSIF